MNSFEKCPVDVYQDSAELDAFLKVLSCRFGDNPINILEIGSMFGGTLWHWMKNLNVANIFVIDQCVSPNDPRFEIQKKCHHELWPQWAHEKGCGIQTTFADSRAIATRNLFKTISPKIDFLFIDGDHTEAAVRSDFQNFSDYVVPGGIIAFHDIAFPETSVHYGVKPLWNKLTQERNTFEIVTSPIQNGIGYFYV